MSRFNQRLGRWPVASLGALLSCGALLLSCGERGHVTVFTFGPPPKALLDYPWTTLAEDAERDGQRPDGADGKSLRYHHDLESDMIWFRFELHGEVDPERPAVSLAIDTDADQGTGVPWYGEHTDFTFDKMLSVGPLEAVGDSVRGYNGITSADGVRRLEWSDERQGVLAFFVDSAASAYLLGVSRTDVAPELDTFNVIGSVGSNARWNDDIGASGFATVRLHRPREDR